MCGPRSRRRRRPVDVPICVWPPRRHLTSSESPRRRRSRAGGRIVGGGRSPGRPRRSTDARQPRPRRPVNEDRRQVVFWPGRSYALSARCLRPSGLAVGWTGCAKSRGPRLQETPSSKANLKEKNKEDRRQAVFWPGRSSARCLRPRSFKCFFQFLTFLPYRSRHMQDRTETNSGLMLQQWRRVD